MLEIFSRLRKLHISIPIIVIILFALPLLGNVYVLHLLITVFIYVTLVEGWDIIGGYGGKISFGHIIFFGMGGYFSALICLNLGLTFPLAILFGGVLTAAVGLPIGFSCLRVRGGYFSAATLILVFIFYGIFSNIQSVTGGGWGLLLPSLDVDVKTYRTIFYWGSLSVALIAATVNSLVSDSKFGWALKAIREDEDVAEVLGVNTMKISNYAFTLSAFFGGIAGGIYAFYMVYIIPSIMFDPFYTVLIPLMAYVGGRGNWKGAFVGPGILLILSEIITFFLSPEIARITYAIIIITIVLLMPSGIFGKRLKS